MGEPLLAARERYLWRWASHTRPKTSGGNHRSGNLMTRPVVTGYPLSPQQRRLWLLQSSQADQSFRSRCSVTIRGALDKNALAAALQKVFDQHKILRTRFERPSGMRFPLQMAREYKVRWANGLDDLAEAASNGNAKTRGIDGLRNEGPADFHSGPAARFRLNAISDDESQLMIDLGALHTDAAGLGNLVQALSQHYGASIQAESVADEPLQYAAYCNYLNDLRESADAEPGKEFWRKQGLTQEALTSLRFGNRAAAEGEFRPDFISRPLNTALITRARAFAETHNAMIEAVFLTCWQILLARICDQTDITVGVGCDGRTDEELKPLIGLLAQYVPLRRAVVPDMSFAETLEQTQNALSEAGRWQECF